VRERWLTELDFVRLSRLNGGQLPASLADDLSAADVVPSREVAPDIVTMCSQVDLRFQATGQRQVLTLSYPVDAAPALGRVSVLSPVGSALLGLRVGDLARWCTPDGAQSEAEVVAVLFQPEAAGDYTT
jgi:regulator of nucleoside diphosphate kinase